MAAAVVEETCLGLAANAEVLALLRARAEEAGGESELSGGDRRLMEYLQGVRERHPSRPRPPSGRPGRLRRGKRLHPFLPREERGGCPPPPPPPPPPPLPPCPPAASPS